MLAELKDLVEKGLFTQSEVKQIMKRRTSFETTLVRRIAKKNDYLRYAAYEMGLEALRKKRVERLKLPRSTPSVSDYALVRRQFHIFERALKKFKSDVALWIQYIQVARKEGARSLVGRICARALQLHPNVPQLYILAASHELSHLSPSSARALLQRGIRLNSDSVEMWREYVKFELGFVEGMRRRWGVLGIEIKGKGKAREDEGLEENDVEKMQVDADGEGDDSEQARKEILQGAIVKSVISHAVKALPKAELFASLHALISTYPAPDAFKDGLMDHLHSLLIQTLPTDPVAVRLTITRSLTTGLGGAVLVDALKEASENFIKAVERSISECGDSPGMATAYAEFVQEWIQQSELDDTLKIYLLASLHSLIRRTLKKGAVLPPLMSAHLSMLASHPELRAQIPYHKALDDLPRRYTATPEARNNARLWISRLEYEKSTDKDRVEQTWKEARAAVQGPDILQIWTWGIPPEDDIETEAYANDIIKTVEELLSESMRMQDAPSFRTIHDELLSRSATLLKYHVSPTDRLAHFRRVPSSYLPDAQALQAFFQSEASLSQEVASPEVLKEIYQVWRRRDTVSASLAWATWLVRRGQGKEASEVVQSSRTEVSGDDAQRQRLEDEWREVLRQMEQGDAQDDQDEDETMADA
ncbi:hypothetical protein EIP86_001379 [Pleurotus ostreatoroseus]|nr:hypothetical protein EIP86_001379 [Pleurotus ostreatoroseus]